MSISLLSEFRHPVFRQSFMADLRLCWDQLGFSTCSTNNHFFLVSLSRWSAVKILGSYQLLWDVEMKVKCPKQVNHSLIVKPKLAVWVRVKDLRAERLIWKCYTDPPGFPFSFIPEFLHLSPCFCPSILPSQFKSSQKLKWTQSGSVFFTINFNPLCFGASWFEWES